MSEKRNHGTMRVAAAAGAAGLGVGWMRAADSLADVVPPNEIEGIWLFPPVRREEREWGVAVISRRADNDRRGIYTVSYMLIVRGRERGQGKVAVEEVGEIPLSVVHEVIKGVQERAGETEPPIEIAPDLWYQFNDEAEDKAAAADVAVPSSEGFQ
ncbi:MAG: hypothetical protein JSW51_07150 [Gemmatimonadota bacterium]|nr:MAG: hypothetical protein JSW51_07150 [Gemmatimonadota bacterium]